ncbi:MAG: HAD family phosphatase [Oscillospiraceae bacterium]|nr:HAD family phosphatase [Oscillospiraceae bacterium]
MIKNVLFDMGSVLVVFDPKEFLRRMGPDDPADRTLLMQELFHSWEWIALDRGALTEAQFIDIVKARTPERLHEAVERLVLHWDDDLLQVEGMEPLVRELSEAGYQLYLLTNAGPRHHEYWPRFSVARYFPADHIYRSCDYLTLKPEREFYEGALARFALDRKECVFIDDSTPNAEAAVRLGLDSIVFQGDAEHLRGKLAEKGVVLPTK